MSEKVILRMKQISKDFPGVKALDHVDFELREGEIHILCGENGAGKSTLMKILAGTYQASAGEIYLNDRKVTIKDPMTSEKLGISIVYQELSLSPSVSVAENIFLGREICSLPGFVDRKKMFNETKRLLQMLNCDIHPNTLVKRLPVAQQQLVQIAKALSLHATIMIMDEPFSALGEEDSQNLFQIMRALVKKGVSMIYIDHRIENFFRIGDRITVLRDGKHAGTRDLKVLSRDEIIHLMVGRGIQDIFPKYNQVLENTMFSVQNVSTRKVKEISFDVKEGEIFGLAGLVGAGRTEIMRAIFALDKKVSGSFMIQGKEVRINAPGDAIKHAIGYVPEDRKSQGLVLKKSVKFNSSLVCIGAFTRHLLVREPAEKRKVLEYVKALNIKTASIDQVINKLSGGNQQKVILAKWLMVENLKVLLLDEPTRGIDVGAKLEIYKLVNDLANKGIAILLITSELPELLGLCDQVAVIKNGRIAGILNKDEMSQERIMELGV